MQARANADEADMGLRSWRGERITAADVTTAKNFLGTGEIRELNRLTDLLLTIFEDQLDLGRLTTMAQATEIFETQLQQLGRIVLRGGGRVSKKEADQSAREEYRLWDERRKRIEKDRVEREYAELKKAAAKRPSARRSHKS